MNVRVVGFDWQATKGIGLYPVPMAARLTGADARKIAGWINGYRGGAPAIIRRQLPLIGGRTVLGFLDLIEVRFIDHFRGLGLSAQLVAEKLRRRQKTDDPFATK
jgi:hypothetical protein